MAVVHLRGVCAAVKLDVELAISVCAAATQRQQQRHRNDKNAPSHLQPFGASDESKVFKEGIWHQNKPCSVHPSAAPGEGGHRGGWPVSMEHTSVSRLFRESREEGLRARTAARGMEGGRPETNLPVTQLATSHTYTVCCCSNLSSHTSVLRPLPPGVPRSAHLAADIVGAGRHTVYRQAAR